MKQTGIDAYPGGTEYSVAATKFEFAPPPRISYGRGASTTAADLLDESAAARAFVVTDANLRRAGVGDALIEGLRRRGSVEVFERVPGEPTASDIDELGRAATAANPTVLVAIGGGATIDSTKCSRVLVDFGGEIRDYALGEGVSGRSSVVLMAVPTTSGTGSETARGALYIDDDTRKKVAVAAPHLLPDFAVVDPDLTFSVPAATTAATGADALAQAVGPYTGPLRHPIVDAIGFEAIRLLASNLARAVRDGSDVEARCALAYGSLMSGLAMNNAEAMADQFIDEVIGPRYEIPHGIVAGLVLPYVVQYNRTHAEARTAALGEAVLAEPPRDLAERADQAVLRLSALMSEIKLPPLAEFGVRKGDLPELAAAVAEHPGVEMELNPRPVTEAGMLALLEAVFAETTPLEMDA